VKLFNNFSKLFPNLTVFDFKLHSTYSSNTLANTLPIFAGRGNYDKKITEKRRSGFGGIAKSYKVDLLGENALWNKLKKQGYMTLLGFDDCDDFFPPRMGTHLNVDFTFRQFYCLAEKFSKIKAAKKFLEQRCIGPHQSHYYMLNYTQTAIRMHPGVNMWAYLHLNAGHEKTGQHAATLNDDVAEFLESFLNEFQETHDFFIYVNADHGMRYGDWFFKNLDAYQEGKMPSMFIIASKTLLDQYPFSYHSLSTNAVRLTSKLDIRETTLFLANITEKTDYSINLISEIASKKRNCQHIGAKSIYCACSRSLQVLNIEGEVAELIKQLLDYAEVFINSNSYSSPKVPLGKVCKKVELDRIDGVYHMDINNVREVFKIEVGTNVKIGIRYEINFLLTTEDEEIEGYEYGNIFEVMSKGFKVKAKVINKQIVDISRHDKYGGKCEEAALNAGINPIYCICAGKHDYCNFHE
jgi:hypothetical protein